ncbi:MAG: hydrogenase maturation nickel metallochaperone HypA [Solirubrobacteraceae bacterium]|jgi:hydrogenase nickel incorporation protein HypA/HybF
MHELSIAESVVRIADRHAAGRAVARVELKVGRLRQVVPSALEFAFQLVAEGTAVEGAELVIEDVPAAGVCRDCGAESQLTGFPFSCTRCGGLELTVIRGEELLVDTLELEEQLTTTGGMDHGD